MNLRTFMTLLLMITLVVTATALPQHVSNDLSAEPGDEKLTAEEEREARELVTLLTRRWLETEDIEPLINEFFVSDFADRLRHEPQMLFLVDLEPDLLAPENSLELRRHYVAMTNFLHLMFRLYEVYTSINLSGEQNVEVDLKEALPANIWNLLKSTNVLLEEELGENAEGKTENPDQSAEAQADAKTIKTIEQLRSVTITLEQAVIHLRDHLKIFPSTLPASEIARGRQSDANSGAAENSDVLQPRVNILGENFYGYPAGTRIIYVNVLPFNINLVRDGDQRLKVLSVHILTD